CFPYLRCFSPSQDAPRQVSTMTCTPHKHRVQSRAMLFGLGHSSALRRKSLTISCFPLNPHKKRSARLQLLVASSSSTQELNPSFVGSTTTNNRSLNRWG